MYNVSFLGVKKPGRAVDRQPPSSAEGLCGLLLGDVYTYLS